MDSLYLILLALFLLVIIPRIMQRRRLAAIRHILNRKMRNKENIEMKELAKRFIGEECIIYTITSNDGSVQGLIKEIDDGGMVIEKKTGELEIINLDFVTRIIENHFVEENIWTMDSDGELRLTIMATLAQEESRKK